MDEPILDPDDDANQPPIVDAVVVDLARCESCCACIQSGERVQFYDEPSTLTGRDVVVHAERCPEPPLWHVEWKLCDTPRWTAPDGWVRARYPDGRDLVEPYEDAMTLVWQISGTPKVQRIRLVRVKGRP